MTTFHLLYLSLCLLAGCGAKPVPTTVNGLPPTEAVARLYQPEAGFVCAGVYIVEDGQPLIATAGHCVDGVGQVFAVSFPELDAGLWEAVADDDGLEVALLRPMGAPFLPPTLSAPVVAPQRPQRATAVTCVGHPLGLDWSFSRGEVVAMRDVGGQPMLQVSCPISQGSSGGPVFDGNTGRVLGLVSGRRTGLVFGLFPLPEENLTLAAPAESLQALVRRL